MADIFISYASKDKERIRSLVNTLESHGWSVFWDQQIPPGMTWRASIGEALKEAKCIVVVWSEASVLSQYVGEEADQGKKRDALIPILLDPVEPPFGFSSIQAADLSKWRMNRPSPNFDRFRDAIENMIGPPGEPIMSTSSPPSVGKKWRIVAYVALVAVMIVGGYLGYATWSNSPEVQSDPEPEQDSSEQPISDFTGGSNRVYSADFSRWSTKTSEHGSVTLGFGNSLVLAPSSNTWIGTKPSTDIPVLTGDFVFDVRFRIEEHDSAASLSFDLTGGGSDAEQVDLFFSIWGAGKVTYTIYKGRVRTGGGLAVPHVVTEDKVAERVQLPMALKDNDWSSGSTLTLKREGGLMQFFINDVFVKEFGVSRFSVEKTSVSAAFRSKVIVTSIEARTKD